VTTDPTCDDKTLALLRETIKHAWENSSYYRKYLQGIDFSIFSFSDLPRLPLLTREDLCKFTDQIITDDCVPEYVGITSGSSSSDDNPCFFLHYQSEAERQIARSIYTFSEVDYLIPLTLRIISSNHGVDINGGQCGVFGIPLEKHFHYQVVSSLLTRKFRYTGFKDRISVIAGSTNLIKLLTTLFEEHGVDPKSLAVDSIFTHGSFLTSQWRERLSNFFGCQVYNVYGMSEVPGFYAKTCIHCGDLHFSPLAVVELIKEECGLDESSDASMAVVTALYPLAQWQPIIRYETGDLFKVMGECAVTKLRRIDFLGRVKNCGILNTSKGMRVVLAHRAIHEVIESCEDISTSVWPRSIAMKLKSPLGAKRYAVSNSIVGNQSIMTITAELKWSPAEFQSRANKLRETLLVQLVGQSQELKTILLSGSFSIGFEFLEPGAGLSSSMS
jgi:phenylacetate-coenzyme A ligase PaaK-like adenylate-forming protein